MSPDDPHPEEELGSTEDGSDDPGSDESAPTQELHLLMTELRGLVDEAKEYRNATRKSSENVEGIAKEVEETKQAINDTTDGIRTRLPATEELITTAEGTCSEIDELHTQATDASSKVNSLISKLKVAEQQVKELESDLEGWRRKYSEYETTIQSLLPGATSAGLASAFAERKNKFLWPRVGWACAFILCICGLLGLAVNGDGELMMLLGSVVDGEPRSIPGVANWPEFVGLIVQKAILAGPLIWLAFYSSRQHGLCQRLDEDYAYKETVSRAFEGYKVQLSEVDRADEESMATTLAANVLDVLNERPGRLYDGKIETANPGLVAADKLQSLLQSLLDIKSTTTDAATLKAVDDGMRIATKLLKR